MCVSEKPTPNVLSFLKPTQNPASKQVVCCVPQLCGILLTVPMNAFETQPQRDWDAEFPLWQL